MRTKEKEVAGSYWMRVLEWIGEMFASPIYAGRIDVDAGRWKIMEKIRSLLEPWRRENDKSNAKKFFRVGLQYLLELL
jgi:hypothetical protein